MDLDQLERMTLRPWEREWEMPYDCHHHAYAISANNGISLDWFFACCRNNPVKNPPKHNPTQIDDLIAQVEAVKEKLNHCEDAGCWVF